MSRRRREREDEEDIEELMRTLYVLVGALMLLAIAKVMTGSM